MLLWLAYFIALIELKYNDARDVQLTWKKACEGKLCPKIKKFYIKLDSRAWGGG